MKILHMLQSNSFSGAENVVCQIISACKNENIEFSYASCDGQIRVALQERGIEFHPMQKCSVLEFKRVISEVKPDIIHAHDMRTSFVAALACGNIPLISHVHNNNYNSRGFSLKSILYWFAAKKAKHVFWVSQSSYDGYAFHNTLKKKSTVLYNIIDVDALQKKMDLDKNNYDYDVVYLGRLTFPKHPQRLIDIFKSLVDKKPDIKLAIIGTGDLENEIKLLAKEKGLSNNLSFLGFQSNPYKILHDAKAMIMTSRWEGTPMCALEAMSLGVPIVSTPTDGLKEVVGNDITGFLDDNDEVLSGKILDIVSDEGLHKRLSQASLNKAILFNDKENYKNNILNIYKNV